MKINFYFLGESKAGSGQAGPPHTSEFAPQTLETAPNEIKKMNGAICQADPGADTTAGSEQLPAPKGLPCDVPDGNARVEWREALQAMARRAEMDPIIRTSD